MNVNNQLISRFFFTLFLAGKFKFFFQGKKVISIATGSLHCVACTDQGEVFTWGDNDEGQLGDGSTNAIQRPRLVAALQGKKINRVACGSAHTLAWSTNKPVATSKLPASVS